MIDADAPVVRAVLLLCGSRVLSLDRPVVMGVLNVTPDSFSDGGQLWHHHRLALDACLTRAAAMVDEGARIVDVGGESTRPGAHPPSLAEEMDRVLPVVEAIASRLDVLISVDTSQPAIMTAAARAGAGIINDVRALQRDGAVTAAAASGLAVCLMHMQGEPASMQAAPAYASVVDDVSRWLVDRVAVCEAAGIARNRLVIDPGFCFGKTAAHNLQLLARLHELGVHGLPVMAGLSRKSLIGTITGRPVEARLPGSLALAQVALTHGARILRVHDVAATMDMLKIWLTVRECGRLNQGCAI